MGEGKRKDAPSGGGAAGQNKKKKTGNDGKWLTPHQQANKAMARDSLPQPGDQGIWVTCARHQEGSRLAEPSQGQRRGREAAVQGHEAQR